MYFYNFSWDEIDVYEPKTLSHEKLFTTEKFNALVKNAIDIVASTSKYDDKKWVLAFENGESEPLVFLRQSVVDALCAEFGFAEIKIQSEYKYDTTVEVECKRSKGV